LPRRPDFRGQCPVTCDARTQREQDGRSAS
jgi:hypothetical protein